MKTYAYTQEQSQEIQAQYPEAGFTVHGDKYLLPADYVDDNGIQKGEPYEYEIPVQSRFNQ